MWFLLSIFLIFALVALLDAANQLTNRTRWAAATAASAVLAVAVSVPADADYLSVSGALRLLPFFLLGYGVARHNLLGARAPGRNPGTLAALAAAFAAAYALRWLWIADALGQSPVLDKAIALSVGATGVLLLLTARRHIAVPVLAWAGGYAFTIYLLHGFSAPAARMALHTVGVHSDIAVFTAALAAGVLAPVAFHIVFSRYRWIRVAVLGERAASGGRAAGGAGATRQEATPTRPPA